RPSRFDEDPRTRVPSLEELRPLRLGSVSAEVGAHGHQPARRAGYCLPSAIAWPVQVSAHDGDQIRNSTHERRSGPGGGLWSFLVDPVLPGGRGDFPRLPTPPSVTPVAVP